MTISILLPALALAWLGFRIFDLQRSYFQLKARASAAGLPVDGLQEGDTMFAYYVAAATLLMLAGLFTRYLLWRDLRRYRQLAATVSHELRTPLTTIQMYAETLALDRVTDPARRKTYLDTIARETRRLEHVLGNILRYVRFDWDVPAAGRQPLAFVEVAQAVLDRMTPVFEHSGHAVRLEGTCAAPVEVDRGAMEHAVENLLVNAVKYSPAGSAITVSLAQEPGRAILQVADEGEGLPADQRNRIFDEFYRAPGTTADGIGLGLPLVRKIVRAHGGDITAAANSPRGAVFRIHLPARAASSSPGERQH